MGYGASIGKCNTCKKIKAVGDMSICRECALSKVDEKIMVCQSCLEEDTSTWKADSSLEATCIDCGENRIVDDELRCKSCHDRQHIRMMEGQIQKTCWNCQGEFIQYHKGFNFCQKCAPSCKGCGGRFSPNNKTEVFCDICLDNLSSHCCTKCETDDMFLNDRGHCSSCAGEGKAETHYCTVCGLNEVHRIDGICEGCKNRVKPCPRCQRNMLASSYLCEECRTEE